MSNYVWSWWEGYTYDWPDWTRPWLAPWRWQNPHCDVAVGDRPYDTTRVVSSEPVVWPAELRDLTLGTAPPSQTPYMGTVGGIPMQLADPNRMRTITVRNLYGGVDVVTGVHHEWQKPYTVLVPSPYRDGWGVEGYPNGLNAGDRHLILVEPDGRTHEMIQFYDGSSTCDTYARWAPDGSPEHLVLPGGATFKGTEFGPQQVSGLLLNRGDIPHRLGMVLFDLAGGDGSQKWEHPRYGDVFRLSAEAYGRLSVGADMEQTMLLHSLHHYGIKPYDKGGNGWHASIGMVAGSQWIGSRLGELRIPIKDLELVTA